MSRPRYNIKITDQAGKVSYMTEGQKCNMEWTKSRAEFLISSSKVLKHFEGCTFDLELV